MLYGIKQGVSEFVYNMAVSYDNALTSNNQKVNIYFSYPVFEMNGERQVIKIMILSTKGIIVLIEDDAERNIVNRHITKILMDVENIALKVLNRESNVYEVHKIDSFNIDTYLKQENIIEENDINLLNSRIQNAFSLNDKDSRVIKKADSLGNKIRVRNEQINLFDSNQFDAIYSENKTNTIIFGLAGSGKTIILVKKMAYMHYQFPDFKMAYVFFTVSLKQYITDLFIKFYKDFNPSGTPNLEKLLFLPAWGTSANVGFYSLMCSLNNVEIKKYREFYVRNSLQTISIDFLEKVKNIECERVFDHVFVDEAQDFPSVYFDMIKKSLKQHGNITYAYDELQSLYEKADLPNPKHLFGNNYKKVELKRSYRSPKEILVTAHSLGLGIYKRNEAGETELPINMISDPKTWESIGYKVIGGELKHGKYVELDRADEIPSKFNESIDFREVSSEEEQYSYVANEIFHLIKNEDILPKDILIIDFDSIKVNENYSNFKSIFFDFKSKVDCSENINLNLVNKDNRLRFRVENSVPYTTIFRAKGNESNVVFLLNTDVMKSASVFSRNRLFTGITRSRFKVYILGSSGISELKQEYQVVKNNNYVMKFKYPTKEELKQINAIAKEQIKSVDSFNKIIELFKDVQTNKELTKELLLTQMGFGSLEELMEYLKDDEKN